MSAFVEKVIAVAINELGVTEVGFTNSGQRVNQYLAAVGLGPGNPWCAAFCFWVTDQSGVPSTAWKDLSNRAYCPTIESWARSKGILGQTPKRGDFMLLQMWDNDGQYSGHIGIVESVDGNQIHTIEGNTSPQGSGGSDDNGGGVYRRVRSAGACKYVRWDALVSAATPERRVKIYRKPDKAVIIVNGVEYPLSSLNIDGKPPEPGSSISIIAEY